jgi:(1->4)-alpha-D-glucan 1-alpha-D-glucosylmutase
VLGGHLGDVVAAGDLELVEQDGEPVLTYFEHRFPLAAGTSTRKPRNEEEMLELLARQHYRLAYWRVAADEINYRRFFDINDFAALCMERPEVFEETHRRIVGLVRTGIVTALRVDHVDGLKDPRGYIERLRDACKPPYLIVEKILGRQETLPAAWDVEGTTGYDMLNVVGGLFVDPRAETPLGELYRKFTGETRSFPELEREKKTLVCNTVLAADVDRLAHQLRALLERRPRTRDFSLRQVREALVAVFSELEVYRTYVRAGESPSRQDVSYVQAACARAAGRVRAGRELLEVVEELLLDPADEDTAELVARFQQVSGPVAAKGVEDTAFYGYGRLIALNEVGGDPGRFGVSPAEFHRECERRQSHHPHALIATSTHDTKRSEDVRARLMLLSEIPDEWAGAVRRWSAANERHKTRGVPEPAAEYFLYQTLVGAHPLEVERAAAYMHKAAKEAKTRTSWVDPDPAYEEALERFVGSVLSDPAFLRSSTPSRLP